ncbi:hypothetical protein BH09BAC5_BH09BAC5_02680 [soil metagenome]
MKTEIDELRKMTQQANHNGNPNSLIEQFKFIRSRDKVAFYWIDDSFTLFFKAPMERNSCQVVFCKVRIENGQIKISARPTLNRVAYTRNLILSILTVICLTLGLILREESFLAIPFMYPFVAGVLFLINRHCRKELKWFLERLVSDFERPKISDSV